MGFIGKYLGHIETALGVMGFYRALEAPIVFETRKDKIFLMAMVIISLLACIGVAGLAVWGIVKLF